MLNNADILFSFFAVAFLTLMALSFGQGLQMLSNLIFKDVAAQDVRLSVFWKLLLGTSFLISSYAIVQTKGITLLLLVPTLLLFVTRQLLRQQVTNATQGGAATKHSWYFLGASVLLNFSFYLWAIQSNDPDTIHYVSGDFNIYYRIAQRLNDFGIESLNLDPIYSAQFAAPYHYGDLWLYALVSKLFQANPSFVFLVSFCVLSIVFVNGVFAFAQERFACFSKKNHLFLFVLLAAGLFTGFNFFFPKLIIPSAEPYTLSVMNWSKVLTPSCFFVALLVLAYRRNWWAMCLLAMVGGLSFINSMPALFMTTFLILFVALMRKQISWKKWLNYHFVYALGTALFVIAFYKVLPSLLQVQAREATGVEIGKALNFQQYLLTAVKIFIGGWFQLFVVTPFVLLLLVTLLVKGSLRSWRSHIRHIDYDILFLIFAVGSGLTCWALLHPFAPDSVQFFTNILAPVYSIFISFVLCYVFYQSESRWLQISGVLLAFVALWVHQNDVFFVQKDDRKEWNKMQGWFSKKNIGYHFVSIRPAGHFNSFFDKNTVYFMPLGQLVYIWPNYHNFSLNAPFLTANEASPYANEERIELEQAPFSVYWNGLKKAEPNIHPEVAMQRFIAEQKVGFITIAQDTVLPEFLRPQVKDSLFLEQARTIVYEIGK